MPLLVVVRGIPTGAIAGVSHYRKALKQDLATILFDVDRWVNLLYSQIF
jgi:hypothetical protein